MSTLDDNYRRKQTTNASGIKSTRETQRTEDNKSLSRNSMSKVVRSRETQRSELNYRQKQTTNASGIKSTRETQRTEDNKSLSRNSMSKVVRCRETQRSELPVALAVDIVRTKPYCNETKSELPVVPVREGKRKSSESQKQGLFLNQESIDYSLKSVNDTNSFGTVPESKREDNSYFIEFPPPGKNICSLVEKLQGKYEFLMYNNDLYVGLNASDNPNLIYYDLIRADQNGNDIRRLIPKEWRKNVRSASDIKELINWLKIDAECFDGLPCYDTIMFQNVAYNWKTEEVVEDTRDLFIRGQLQIEYNSGNRNGVFDELVQSMFDDRDTITAFYQFLGLCFSDVRFLKYIFYLYGDTHSGKTVITDLITKIVNPKYVSGVSFSDFSNEFYVASMLNSKINIGSEISGSGKKRAETILSLSGREIITASGKYTDPFQKKSDCLLVFSTSSFPKISLKSAMIQLLERTIIFPIKKIKKRKNWNPELLQQLLRDSDSIVELALKGLRELSQNNWVFKQSEIMLNAINEFRKESNNFYVFIEETFEITKDKNDCISSAEIDSLYDEYCYKRHIYDDILPQNQRSQVLVDIYGLKKDFVARGIRGYKGIRFLEDKEGLSENNENDSNDDYWNDEENKENEG